MIEGCVETRSPHVIRHTRRVVARALFAVGAAGLLVGGLLPAAARAQRAQSIPDAVPIAEGDAPVVDYGSGFATAAITDHGNKVLLFTEPFGATSWTKKVLDSKGQTYGGDGSPTLGPAITTNGDGTIAIAALSATTGTIDTWIGGVNRPLSMAQLPYEDEYYTTPSVAYSAAGNNFVVATTDSGGGVDYFYSTTKTGGWVQQVITTGTGYYSQAVATTTSSGVVVAATQESAGTPTNIYYQPYSTTGWTVAGQLASTSDGLSITATGGTAALCLAVSNSVQELTLSDTGEIEADNTVASDVTSPTTFPYWYLWNTAIAWSGTNVVVTFNNGNDLQFYYSDPDVTTFYGPETIAKATYYSDPSVAVGDSTVQVVAPSVKGTLLGSWSQVTGGTSWTYEQVWKS